MSLGAGKNSTDGNAPEGLPPGVPKVTLAVREPRLRRPPFVFIALFMILIIASWVPLVIFARSRAVVSTEPRVSLVQDMGLQPKYSVQQFSDIFNDNRADRPHVEGTVGRGQAYLDDFYYRGFSGTLGANEKLNGTFYDGFPDQVKVTSALLARGQQRFGIYCSVCHGLDGHGHGQVNERELELAQLEPASFKWTPPADLHSDLIRSRPNGHIFNTISNGIRSMPAYGKQIPEEDRWAIVAYVRALQLSQHAPAGMVPAGVKVQSATAPATAPAGPAAPH